MNITEHFTWEEACVSDIAARRGFDNSIPPELRNVVINTACNMEVTRELLAKPISITSWYRSPLVNKVVGSANTSQHLKGEAVDFICPLFGTPAQVCQLLVSKQANFDQLILEHTWVHISFSVNPDTPNRHQVLSLLSNGKYANGLTDREGNPI